MSSVDSTPDRYRAVLTRLTGNPEPTADELAGDGVMMNILEAVADRLDRLDELVEAKDA